MKLYIAFIFWIIGTVCLVGSVIGMLLFWPTEYTTHNEPSSWMKIGLGLMDAIKRDLNK